MADHPELSDEAIVSEVVDRVAASYPGRDKGQLTVHVRTALDRFGGAKIRAFLPVLVERQVTATLRGSAAS